MRQTRSDRTRLLEELDRRLGYAGCAEYWLHIEMPARADEQQLQNWQALPKAERQRVAEQFDRLYGDMKYEIVQERTRLHRVKNGIRSVSAMLAFIGILVLCPGIGNMSGPDAGSASFLPFWWLVSLAVMASLYGSGCKLGERWFDLGSSQDFGLRP